MFTINRGLLTFLFCFSFLLPVVQARDCAIEIVSATDSWGTTNFYLPLSGTGSGNPSISGSYAKGSTGYATVKSFPSVIVEPAIYTDAIYNMYNGGLSPLEYSAWAHFGDAGNQQKASVPLSVILSGDEITFRADSSKLDALVSTSIVNNNVSLMLANYGGTFNGYGKYIVGKSYASAHLGWCAGPASAGSEASVILRQKNYAELGDARIESPDGTLLYSGVSVRDINYDGVTNTIKFIEIPYISVSTRVSEIDFLSVESGKSAVQSLDMELSSNAVSAGVTLTYEFKNVKNTARFSIKGLNGGLQENVVTSSTKNEALQISRYIEISEDDNTITGPYEGILSITATMP